MRTIFSTESLHPRDRLSHWLDVTCRMVVAHDSRPYRGHPFRAELAAESLADLRLLQVTISPNAITHDKRHISRSLDDDLLICRALAGRFTVEQDDREAIVQPGKFVLLDKRLPYTAQLSSQQSKVLVLRIPRRALECRIGRIEPFVARSKGRTEGVDSLTSSFLEMLPDNVTGLGKGSQEMIRTQLLDLLAESLSHNADTVRLPSTKEGILLKLRAAIAARLSQRHVSVGEIAAAAGVSVRYANALLATQGQSISELIQVMRLERCSRALEDVSQAHRNISEIAYAWGFSDVTHFGRRFKKRYGVLPSEWRKRRPEHFLERSTEWLEPDPSTPDGCPAF